MLLQLWWCLNRFKINSYCSHCAVHWAKPSAAGKSRVMNIQCFTIVKHFAPIVYTLLYQRVYVALQLENTFGKSSATRWGYLTLAICTHARVKYQENRGVFSSVIANIFPQKIWKKGHFQDGVVYTKYKQMYFAIREFSLEKEMIENCVWFVFLKCEKGVFFIKMYIKR